MRGQLRLREGNPGEPVASQPLPYRFGPEKRPLATGLLRMDEGSINQTPGLLRGFWKWGSSERAGPPLPTRRTAMADEENTEYGLVMPFVVVASKGGPFEDQAYVAGYEMGLLDEALKWQPPTHSTTIRSDNVQQADLIAMRRGYRCTAEPSEDVPEWTHVAFEPTVEEATP